MNMNVVPKDGGNLFHCERSRRKGRTTTSRPRQHQRRAARARSDDRRARSRRSTTSAAASADRSCKDKVWFYGGCRDWGSVQNIAGVYFNKPANQASLSPRNVAAGGFPPISRPDTTRPAFYDRTPVGRALRLTWQAERQEQDRRSTAACRSTAGATRYFIDEPGSGVGLPASTRTTTGS